MKTALTETNTLLFREAVIRASRKNAETKKQTGKKGLIKKLLKRSSR